MSELSKSTEDSFPPVKKSLSYTSGDLQRSLQKEVSWIGGIALCILIAWSSINHYYGSYLGGKEWLKSSGYALSQYNQTQEHQLLERLHLLLDLPSPQGALKSHEHLLIFTTQGQNWQIKHQFGGSSPEWINHATEWLGQKAKGEALPSGYLLLQNQLWLAGVIRKNEQWGVLYSQVNQEWMEMSRQLSSAEIVIMGHPHLMLESSFLDQNEHRLFPHSTFFQNFRYPQPISLNPSLSTSPKDHNTKKTPIPPSTLHLALKWNQSSYSQSSYFASKSQRTLFIQTDHGPISFSSPYKGHSSQFHQNDHSFDAFYSLIPFISPQGQIVGWLWLFIPENVMLFWPKVGIMGMMILGFSLICIFLWRTRRQTQKHLSPLSVLIEEIELLSEKFGGVSTFKALKQQGNFQFNDLHYLQKAITHLKDKITENHQLEEQLRQAQKLEAVGTLAGGVAHDFNNLLSVLLLNSESLQLDLQNLNLKSSSPASFQNLQAEWAEMIEEMITTCKQARLLTRQLLNLSRDQGGQAAPFNLSESLQESITLLHRLIPSHIHFDTDLGDEPLWVSGNENAFQQVIMNLVLNGCDAIEERGEISLLCSTYSSMEPKTLTAGIVRKGQYVKVEVKDTGKGMDKQMLSQIFEPFFTSKGKKGTGLGLTVVYTALVRRMKGAIDVESYVGQGTTFSLYLPLIRHSPKKRPLFS